MSYYRHLPTVIQARLLTEDNGPDIATWCGGEWHPAHSLPQRGGDQLEMQAFLAVPTINGEVTAFPGQHWIAKGTVGEYYPIRNDVFQASYEPAEVPDGVGTGAE